MNEAIKLAIEKGGYKTSIKFSKENNYKFGREWDGTELEPLVFMDEIKGRFLLDPLFWQALGKALGWYTGHENITLEEYEKKNWKSIALRYFELKLTNGDETKFWRELQERQE